MEQQFQSLADGLNEHKKLLDVLKVTLIKLVVNTTPNDTPKNKQ